MGPGQRMDVMVKAPGTPGTYLLQTLDPNSGEVKASVSPYLKSSNTSGIAAAWRPSRHSFDFPSPCPGLGNPSSSCVGTGQFSYPVTLATIVVSGATTDMNLPADPLPTPQGLPSIATMLSRTPDAVRNIVFELCGSVPAFQAFVNLPSCGWYLAKYNATYWGGTPFTTLQMMRDADDVGEPNPNPDPSMPRINFKKEGLFDPLKPLFPDMIAGNYEEWTVYNRTFSDHPFHLHQNHVLITQINGITLPLPEWHDTLVVPAAQCPPDNNTCGGPPVNINLATPGSITFRHIQSGHRGLLCRALPYHRPSGSRHDAADGHPGRQRCALPLPCQRSC